MAWSQFKKVRRRILAFLIGERNKEKIAAVFADDFKKIEKLDYAINFLDAFDSQYINVKGNCPICGSKSWYRAKLGHIILYNAEPNRRMEKWNLSLHICGKCGFYIVGGL